MARVLFGTDGIRGVAGQAPLDRKTAQAVGAALGQWIIDSKQPHRAVVIGMDTRESGPWLAAEVASGIESRRVQVEFAGVTTTPGVAYLAKNGPFAAGVMISASHNPYLDNGIKLIGHAGYKLPDEQEERLETEIFTLLGQGLDLPAVRLMVNEGLDRTYMDHLARTLPGGLDGLSVVTDCANGSASAMAPELFERLGARVHPDPLHARRPQYQSELRVATSGSVAGCSARAEGGRRCRIRWRCRSCVVRIAIRKNYRRRCGALPDRALLKDRRSWWPR